MHELLRGIVSAVGDALAWYWGLQLIVLMVVGAVLIAPDAPGLALFVIGIVVLVVTIPVVTAYAATVRARERYERHLRDRGPNGPDMASGPG